MPFLAVSQSNAQDNLNLFMVGTDGFVFDSGEVKYRVFDNAGTQVFPQVAPNYEDVTTGSGKFDTGSYYAYDNGNSIGFNPTTSPAAPLTVGDAYRIEWTYEDEDGNTQTKNVWFSVSAAGIEAPYFTYLTIKDIRDEGILVADLSDAKALSLIQMAQELLEDATHNFFRPVPATVKFDGDNSPLALFSIPIIGAHSLHINDNADPLDSSYVKVYNGIGVPQDDRRNPRIQLYGSNYSDDFYARLANTDLVFGVGKQSHSFKAVWGFLERSGSFPLLIRNAMLRLVLGNATDMEIGVSTGVPSGLIVEEKADRHSIRYAEPNSGAGLDNPLYVDAVVEGIIARYRCAMGIGGVAPVFGIDRGFLLDASSGV